MEINNLEVTIRPRLRVDSSGECNVAVEIMDTYLLILVLRQMWIILYCCFTEGIMLESMFSSMTTSLQLANECLRQENDQPADNTSQPFEGLELFAQAIEAGMAGLFVTIPLTVSMYVNIAIEQV